jgi:phosphoglycolate phosphatase
LLETRVFDQAHWLLGELEARALPWGIVTNKATRFAEPVVRGWARCAQRHPGVR